MRNQQIFSEFDFSFTLQCQGSNCLINNSSEVKITDNVSFVHVNKSVLYHFTALPLVQRLQHVSSHHTYFLPTEKKYEPSLSSNIHINKQINKKTYHFSKDTDMFKKINKPNK